MCAYTLYRRQERKSRGEGKKQMNRRKKERERGKERENNVHVYKCINIIIYSERQRFRKREN